MEYELNPSARAWVGMEQVNPNKTYDRCFITYQGRGKKTVTFRSLDLKGVTFRGVKSKIPVLTEHIITLPAPTHPDKVASGYNLQDKSQWKPHKPARPRLDEAYPDLDIVNH